MDELDVSEPFIVRFPPGFQIQCGLYHMAERVTFFTCKHFNGWAFFMGVSLRYQTIANVWGQAQVYPAVKWRPRAPWRPSVTPAARCTLHTVD